MQNNYTYLPISTTHIQLSVLRTANRQIDRQKDKHTPNHIKSLDRKIGTKALIKLKEDTTSYGK